MYNSYQFLQFHVHLKSQFTFFPYKKTLPHFIHSQETSSNMPISTGFITWRLAFDACDACWPCPPAPHVTCNSNLILNNLGDISGLQRKTTTRTTTTTATLTFTLGFAPALTLNEKIDASHHHHHHPSFLNFCVPSHFNC